MGALTYGERSAKNIPYRIAGRAARTAQYRTIYHLKEEFPVKAMCEFFAVSRAAYYEWVKTLEEPDPDQARMEQVRLPMKLRTEPMATVGLPWTFSKNRGPASITRLFCG